jgi:hypothetical protein
MTPAVLDHVSAIRRKGEHRQRFSPRCSGLGNLLKGSGARGSSSTACHINKASQPQLGSEAPLSGFEKEGEEGWGGSEGQWHYRYRPHSA